jgi:hypothetical protein
MANTDFKFPDETGDEKGANVEEEKLEIEVVDDTPEEDRNRKAMKEAPTEVTDEELEGYSEKVRGRIQHFTKGYHEERRAKEAAVREKDEALRIAQKAIEENKQLQGNLTRGQTALLEQAKKVVDSEIENAKRQYKAAHEAGDSDALVIAQEALTAAKIKSDRLNNFKPAPLQAQQDDVQSAAEPVKTSPRSPQVDPKAEAWREANPWFGADRRKTALALAVHQDLMDEGVNPTSDEYYRRIDKEITQIFSPKSADADTSTDKKVVKQSNVVAPATRSTAPRKIVLTQTQVNIAKRLGVPLELYAKQVAEDMRKQNG